MFLTASGDRRKERFSLLLLDEGEYYFEDFSANYWPRVADNATLSPNQRQVKVKGRLKLCSGSLIFEPEDIRLAITKIPFRMVQYIDYWLEVKKFALGLNPTDIFIVRTTAVIEMKENNLNAPYRQRQKPDGLHFSFNYAVLDMVLAKILMLFNISKLQPMERELRLKEMVEERERDMSFDPSWMVDHSERPELESTAVKVQPLANNPGRVMLTNKRLYFQPMNNISANPVERFALSSIISLSKRRHHLRDVGVEIFMENETSLLLAFKTPSERDTFTTKLLSQTETRIRENNDLFVMMKQWQEGLVSNYDYLMFLNRMAGRSCNDLTQYPVFPWVISKYDSKTLDLNDPSTFRDLSKPIGALNHQRLTQFRERYKMMPDDQPRFLYGTHYSTPGYVLFYLVRQAPEYMLRLQNGKFDAPDRMFHSIQETWEGVLQSSSDVKELIPEFYTPPGDFLSNIDGLILGARQNGTVLGDVALPPWAKNARDFITKCREALECDYVSARLHEWIDLIFGFKQRGEEALRADNLFYHLTYEGAVDIDSVRDPVQRASLEAQISEFGQTPKQLLRQPHPRKLPIENRGKGLAMIPLSVEDNDDLPVIEAPIESLSALGISLPPLTISESAPSKSPWHIAAAKLKPTSQFKLHKDMVSDLCLSKNGETLYSVSKDTFLKVYSIPERRQLRSVSPCNLALSSCALDNQQQKTITLGSWDNNVYIYSVDYGRILDSLCAHDDAVSTIRLQQDVLATGSWDSTVKVWKQTPTGLTRTPLAHYTENDAMIKCVDLSPGGNLVVASAADGHVMYADLRERGKAKNLRLHRDSVNSISFTNNGDRVISCSNDGSIRITEFGGNDLFTIRAEEPLRTIATDGTILFAGGESGRVRAWDLSLGNEITGAGLQSCRGGPINKLVVDKDSSLLVVGCEDATIQTFQL